MKTELKQIIKELSEVIEEEKLNITHSELMDFAVRILNSQSINKTKFNNFNINNELPPSEKDGLATPQQKFFLKKAGKTFQDNISKKEAFILIKELKK